MGKNGVIPESPMQGSCSPVPPGCAEPRVVDDHRTVVVDTLPLKTSKGQGLLWAGLAVLAQGPATAPGHDVPAGPGWIWAEPWPA